MSSIKKINTVTMRAFEMLLAILGTMMVTVVVGNVFCRYLLHTTIPWAEELARFSFIWVTFIGTVLANDKTEHMQLDFIVNAFPKKISKFLSLIALLVVMVLLGFLIRGGIQYTMTQWDWMTSALHARAGLVYSIAPISMLIMEFQFIARFISGIIHFKD
nr:TRAP transporter small permease [uncultured Caproiciproducens sp.]